MTSANREAFETALPRPDGVYWDDQSKMYVGEIRDGLQDFRAAKYHFKFMGWVAAMKYLENKDIEAHGEMNNDH